MNKHDVEYTDTFGGEANYTWVRRATIDMPELTHYGYTGSTDGSYAKANRVYERELMKRAKAAMNITGSRGRVERYGDSMTFRPSGGLTVMFITWHDE